MGMSSKYMYLLEVLDDVGKNDSAIDTIARKIEISFKWGGSTYPPHGNMALDDQGSIFANMTQVLAQPIQLIIGDITTIVTVSCDAGVLFLVGIVGIDVIDIVEYYIMDFPNIVGIIVGSHSQPIGIGSLEICAVGE